MGGGWTGRVKLRTAFGPPEELEKFRAQVLTKRSHMQATPADCPRKSEPFLLAFASTPQTVPLPTPLTLVNAGPPFALHDPPMAAHPISHRDVTAVFGELTDRTVLALIGAGATRAQLEEVKMWLDREDDVMGNLARPLTAELRRLYDILMADEALLPDDDRRD